MESLIAGLLLAVVCALAFACYEAGRRSSSREQKRNADGAAEEAARAKRLQTELENLFRYDGTPQ